MPLPYNPQDFDESDTGSGWTPKEGEYDFKIDKSEEGLSKAKNPKVTVTLLVDAGGRYDVKCFDHLALTKAALWKLNGLCKATGVPFDPPPEAYQFENKMGRAKFVTEEYNGYTNLKVDRYIPRPDVSRAEAIMAGDEPPPPSDEDLPPSF